MHVSDILTTKGAAVVTAAPDATVLEAAEQIALRRIGSILVVDGAQTGLTEDPIAASRILGILTERDLVRALAASEGACFQVRAEELADADYLTCKQDDSLRDILAIMTETRRRHLPVVTTGSGGSGSADSLAGLISLGDVVKHRLIEAEAEAAHMAEYVRSG